jgi:outer membrane lipoprotein SlyB
MIHECLRPGRALRRGLAFAALAALAGCAPNYSPDTYSSAAVQQANKVERGLIVGVRKVDVSAPGTVGALAGGAAGGAVGAQVPGSVLGATFGAIGGTVIGGLVGTTVEHTTADTTAFEYIVRKPNGDMISVTQKDKDPLAVGQVVLVIAGSQARIVPDYTTPEPAPTPAPIVVTPLPAPAAAAATAPPAPAPTITLPSFPVPAKDAPAASALPSLAPAIASEAAKL